MQYPFGDTDLAARRLPAMRNWIWKVFRYVLSWLRPPRKLQFTREGKWFILLTLAVGAAAINTGVNLLYLVLAMLLSLIIVSGILSEIVLRDVTLTRLLPDYVVAGTPFSYKVILTNQKRYFSSFSLHLVDSFTRETHVPTTFQASVLCLGPQQHMTLFLEGILDQRGLHTLQQVELSTCFPFGFFRKSRRLPVAPVSLLILPALGKITSFPLGGRSTHQQWNRETTAHRGEGEFHKLREYQPGDNPRWIHWRSSAKHQRLLVKEFVQEQRWTVTILLDTQLSVHATSGEKAHLETAIHFVATLAVQLLERDLQVTIAAYTPRLTVQTVSGGGRRRALPLLKSLALLEPAPDREVIELYHAVRPSLSAGMLVMVVLRPRALSGLFPSPQKGQKMMIYDVTAPSFSAVFTLQ